jgi:asparagine N-glycosylation enzyme membrane subunit Stt3
MAGIFSTHLSRRAAPGRELPGATWEVGMLTTLFAILLVLWLLGMVSSYTMGGFIHVLLVVAIVVLLVRLIQGRRLAR